MSSQAVSMSQRFAVPEEFIHDPFSLVEARRAGVTKWQLRGSQWRRLGAGFCVHANLALGPKVMLQACSRRLRAGAVFRARPPLGSTALTCDRTRRSRSPSRVSPASSTVPTCPFDDAHSGSRPATNGRACPSRPASAQRSISPGTSRWSRLSSPWTWRFIDASSTSPTSRHTSHPTIAPQE